MRRPARANCSDVILRLARLSRENEKGPNRHVMSGPGRNIRSVREATLARSAPPGWWSKKNHEAMPADATAAREPLHNLNEGGRRLGRRSSRSRVRTVYRLGRASVLYTPRLGQAWSGLVSVHNVRTKFLHVRFASAFGLGDVCELVAAGTGKRMEVALHAGLHASTAKFDMAA